MSLKEVFLDILYGVCVLGLALLLVTFVGQRIVVEGSSMEPTLSDGDTRFVNKFIYDFNEPERFDIIVFPNRNEPKTYLIKRIIGLPGDSVLIKDSIIYINGKELIENYGLELMEDSGIALDEILLGDDEYFVLGDNRNNSLDSRNPAIGPVKKDNIVGRVNE